MNYSSLTSLEQMRKKAAVKVFSILFLVGFILVSVMVFLVKGSIYLYNLESTDQETELMLSLTGFLFLILFLSGYYFIRLKNRLVRHFVLNSEYGKMYRKEVVAKAVSELKGELIYDAEGGISRSGFTASGFPMFENPARYSSYGGIRGKIGKTDFVFAEVFAEQISESSSYKEQYTDLFRGVFFIADIRKEIKGATIIYPDMMKYFSFLLFPKNGESGFKKVNLEDVRFEKYFEVFGTDQVESRYILSPALMSRIVNFREKNKKQMQFSFIGDKVYFGIHYPVRKSLYKPPLFSSVYNQKPLKNYISDLKFMLEIIKELNVNSQINPS